MACTFFYSDPHFTNEGVCKFLRSDGTKLRPWDNAADMDTALIENFNSVVRDQDKTYFLGDICFKDKHLEILGKLNGSKVLIHGNHDQLETKKYLKYFKSVYGVRVLSDMILTHIPIHPDCLTKRYRVNVCGHTHANNIMLDGHLDSRYYNVSVEQIDFTPISIEDLRIKILERQEKFPPVYPVHTPKVD